MRPTFLTAVLFGLCSLVQAAPDRIIGAETGFDITELLKKLEADPDDKAKRFTFPRNVHAGDLPEWDGMSYATADRHAEAVVKDLERALPHDQAKRDRAIAAVRLAGRDRAFKIDPSWTCSPEHYERVKTAVDSAIYLAYNSMDGLTEDYPLFNQLFGSDLPAAGRKKIPGMSTMIKKIIRPVYQEIAELVDTPKNLIPVKTRPRPIVIACHTKFDGNCLYKKQVPGMSRKFKLPNWTALAYTMGREKKKGKVVPRSVMDPDRTIHLCPPFFELTDSNTDRVPRRAEDSGKFCSDSPKKIGRNAAATILHELTHLRLGNATETEDVAYDIRRVRTGWVRGVMGEMKDAIDESLGQLHSERIPGQKMMADTILGLTPEEAQTNADTYAWFSLLRLRQRMCNIKVDTAPETWSCYPKSYRDFLWRVHPDGKEYLEAEVPCQDSCEASATSGNRNTKRTTSTGKTCCPKNQIAYDKTDPRTKKKITDCKCAPNFKQTGTGDTKKCVLDCPKGTIKSKNTSCIKCPTGQTPNAAQTSCVKQNNGNQNSKPANGDADSQRAELQDKLDKLRREQEQKKREREAAERERAERLRGAKPGTDNKPSKPKNCRGKLCWLKGGLEAASGGE